ncbi:MAG TPA: aminodeoxychorismate lyase, partial [Nitrospina sp.]|nr:aminodeoxychorismate lyase [Nitrospina sp.]
MKSPIKPNLFPLFAGLVLFIWVLSGFFYYQISNPAGESTQAIPISIPPGATLKQISDDLKDHNLIKNASAFRLLASIRKKQTHIQVGEYELNQSMLPIDILKAITSGKTVLHPITIPEGYR